MKKILLTLVAAFSLSVSLSAQTDVSAVVGDYTGELYVALGEEIYDANTLADKAANVSVTAATTAGKVDFKLPNFSFAGMQLGDIALPGIGLNKGEDNYTFAVNDTVTFKFLGVIEATATLDSKRSYVKGDSIIAYVPVYWIQSANTKTPIYVLFKGKKTAAPEPVDVTPVVGDYTGELYVALTEEIYDENTLANKAANVSVTAATTAGKVDFKLPNFSFANMQLGDIALPGIGLNKGEDNYTFAVNDTVTFKFLGVIEATATLDSKRSYVKGDSIIAYVPVYWIQSANVKTPIYVLFKGKKAGTTGIGAAPQATETAAPQRGVYTLSGIRVADSVNANLPKGLYIVDGKKTLVR